MNKSGVCNLSILCIIMLFSSCKKDPLDPIDNPNVTTIINCEDDNFPLHWKKKNGLETDYLVKCEFNIPAGKTLVVDPGVRIKFEGSDASIYATDGFLKMIGSADNPIILEGSNPVRGSWKGVFISSNSTDNQLSYVTIRHAGSQPSYWLAEPCGLGLERASSGIVRLSMSHCTLDNNEGNGMAVYEDNIQLQNFENNIFSNNTLAPLVMTTANIEVIHASNTFINNGFQRVIMYTNGGAYSADKDVVVPHIHIPYRFKSDLWPTRNIKIQPGTVLEFEPGTGIYIDGSTSSISAVGTNDSPVIMRGLQDNLQGQWRGIYINTTSPLNKLEYCHISGGGENAYWSYDANIEINRGNRINIQNCVIRDSGGYGITYSAESIHVSVSDNIFDNNNNEDIWIH